MARLVVEGSPSPPGRLCEFGSLLPPPNRQLSGFKALQTRSPPRRTTDVPVVTQQVPRPRPPSPCTTPPSTNRLSGPETKHQSDRHQPIIPGVIIKFLSPTSITQPLLPGIDSRSSVHHLATKHRIFPTTQARNHGQHYKRGQFGSSRSEFRQPSSSSSQGYSSTRAVHHRRCRFHTLPHTLDNPNINRTGGRNPPPRSPRYANKLNGPGTTARAQAGHSVRIRRRGLHLQE